MKVSGPGREDENGLVSCLDTSLELGDIAELIGGSAEPTGRSTMRADRAGRIHRHHGVARTYADLCFEAGHRVWTEAPVFPEFSDAMSTKARGGVLRGSLRRIDVLATPIGGLTGHAIDPRVMDPARHAAGRRQSEERLDAARHRAPSTTHLLD